MNLVAELLCLISALTDADGHRRPCRARRRLLHGRRHRARDPWRPGLFPLLVVPPDTLAETTRAAPAEAVPTENRKSVKQILTDTCGGLSSRSGAGSRAGTGDRGARRRMGRS